MFAVHLLADPNPKSVLLRIPAKPYIQNPKITNPKVQIVVHLRVPAKNRAILLSRFARLLVLVIDLELRNQAEQVALAGPKINILFRLIFLNMDVGPEYILLLIQLLP